MSTFVFAGRPHYCYFHVTHTEDCVEWFNEKKRIKKALLLRDVIELKTGQVNQSNQSINKKKHDDRDAKGAASSSVSVSSERILLLSGMMILAMLEA